MPAQLGQNKFLENALKYGFSFWGTPKTGQITQYRAGDDGDLEKGYPLNPPRFRDNGNNTITDLISGLMWVKNPGAMGPPWGSAGSPDNEAWNQAVDMCAELNYRGHTDWRLPNIHEIRTILDFSKSNPTVDVNFFPWVQNDHWWSSTTHAGFTTSAYYVNVYHGTTLYDNKGFGKKPRPVRGP